MILAFIDSFFWVYMMLLFARIIGSWIPELQQYQIMQFVNHYTDPYLNVFKRFIPPLGMIDISPIIAFLCLGVIEHLIKGLVITLFY